MGQPVLVGTVSIEKSELLSDFLQKEGVKHEVLNARMHEREAHIVAQAGRLGAVTIATNMAGRGTDIQLGGNIEFRINDELVDMAEGPDRDAAIAKIREEVLAEREQVRAAGGLFVLATERHESRRIDNQLRGRSGRQGDPGLSRFYLSLDDDLLRIFGTESLFARMMNSSLEDGEAIGGKWLSKAIETAQRKVEARNYDIRKQLVEYDDVMNDQRRVIYDHRAEVMDAEEVGDIVEDFVADSVGDLVARTCPEGTYPEQWLIDELKRGSADLVGEELPIDAWLNEEAIEPMMIEERLNAHVAAKLADKKAGLDPSVWTQVEKSVLLQTLDGRWKDHLATLDALRQVVHLRAYAQKNPVTEYKREAFVLFNNMLDAIRVDVTKTLSKVGIQVQPEITELPELPDFLTTHIDPFTGDDNSFDDDAGAQGLIANTLPPRQMAAGGENPWAGNPDIRRNDPCPCGSGRKYKHCHGQY